MNEQHATKTAWGQPVSLCDDARRFLRQRATGSGGEGFTLRGFSTESVTCADCSAVLAQRSAFALPMPEVQPTTPIKNPIGRAIRESMRRRYGPSIEDPEWTTEGFVPR